MVITKKEGEGGLFGTAFLANFVYVVYLSYIYLRGKSMYVTSCAEAFMWRITRQNEGGVIHLCSLAFPEHRCMTLNRTRK